ncbi:PREDICTED: protein LKAAEAR1-like [Branchiostoma belcheri]|uniref:Protein LKAAEAR1-like n=1 Tax=Branchiostoma belcheri TaxID=7741 RepID=A0A6P4YTG7_BRABE|nr:PREDICTED: protein LKAAEAR1-like [Branchiostoma belcheri]KAI8506111.1 LKAAEAR motif-containing protein [Branchiostoma belcheri]
MAEDKKGSKVTLPPLKKGGDDDGPKEKFVAKNWRQLSPRTLNKMAPQEKSKYLAYEEPSKPVQEAQASTLKRVRDLRKAQRRANPPMSMDEFVEKEKHSKLIGQLKAAEARNRLRVMRLRYQSNRAQEVKHLIACQPHSLKALRLEALVPPYLDNANPGDKLDRMQRARVEGILEDDKGLTTVRYLDY